MSRKSHKQLDTNNPSDEGEDELATMLDAAMERQWEFAGLNGRFDEIKKDLANCAKDVRELRNDHNDLRKKVNKTEKTTMTIQTK